MPDAVKVADGGLALRQKKLLMCVLLWLRRESGARDAAAGFEVHIGVVEIPKSSCGTRGYAVPRMH